MTRAEKQKSYVLLIIDVQPDFSASFNPGLLASITAQIKKAKKLKNPILLVELRNKTYQVYQATQEKIRRRLKNYRRKAVAYKPSNDGSRQIIQKCRKLRWSTKNFMVTGIHTSLCVRATVDGLLSRLTKTNLTVIRNGCRDYCVDTGRDPEAPEFYDAQNRIRVI